MRPQLGIFTVRENAATSSPNLIGLDSLSELLVRSFFESGQQCTTFRSAVAKFDRFFHIDLLNRYSEDDLPRFHLAVHSTDEAIVLEYPDHAGFGPFLKQALTGISARMGYEAEIQMKSVMTIRGPAERFLIELS